MTRRPGRLWHVAIVGAGVLAFTAGVALAAAVANRNALPKGTWWADFAETLVEPAMILAIAGAVVTVAISIWRLATKISTIYTKDRAELSATTATGIRNDGRITELERIAHQLTVADTLHSERITVLQQDQAENREEIRKANEEHRREIRSLRDRLAAMGMGDA